MESSALPPLMLSSSIFLAPLSLRERASSISDFLPAPPFWPEAGRGPFHTSTQSAATIAATKAHLLKLFIELISLGNEDREAGARPRVGAAACPAGRGEAFSPARTIAGSR